MFDDDSFKTKRKNRPSRSWAQIAIVALAAVLVIGTLLNQANPPARAPIPTPIPTLVGLTPQGSLAVSPTPVPPALRTSTPIVPLLSVELDFVRYYSSDSPIDIAWFPLDGPNGGKLASDSYREMNVYDPVEPYAAPLSFQHRPLGRMMAMSQDGTLAAFVSGNDVSLVDLATFNPIASLEGNTSGVNSVAFSPDGTLVASAGWDSTLRLWHIDMAAGTYTQAAVIQHPDRVSSVAFSPDGEYIATGCSDGHLRLWNTQSILRGSQDPQSDRVPLLSRVDAVAISPDGRIIASRGGNSIYLYNIDSDNITLLGQHRDTVKALSFSPDGRLLASAGNDNFVRIWDVAAGVKVAEEYGGNTREVAFSRDGRWLASVSYPRGLMPQQSYTLTLWSVTVKQ